MHAEATKPRQTHDDTIPPACLGRASPRGSSGSAPDLREGGTTLTTTAHGADRGRTPRNTAWVGAGRDAVSCRAYLKNRSKKRDPRSSSRILPAGLLSCRSRSARFSGGTRCWARRIMVVEPIRRRATRLERRLAGVAGLSRHLPPRRPRRI